ncbi:MAG: nucleotide pyrophosphohydrolase [Gaiellales bacterium]|nr:MAG: nucleotide pyrophosphohydrolase [Gaiellales bacterium]
MEKLKEQLAEFSRERDWEQFHSPKNLAMALAVEAAEIMEHFQWLTQEESRDLDQGKLANVREEIGDVMIYLTELSAVLGVDPLAAAWDKLEKNRRKYPADAVRGKALKYSEYRQD